MDRIGQRDSGYLDRVRGVIERGLAAARRDFDPRRNLIANPAAPGATRTYRPPQSLPFAQALLREGDAESTAQAARIVSAVLDSQETDRSHPHCGNFLWLADDPEVVDLNAVQFVLRGLLPILVRYGHQLPADLIARARQSVRLALEEEERIDVAPTYTNIHLMSLLSLLVGGEWLDDAHFLALGRARWQGWVRFTVESGAVHEYASHGYGSVDLSALADLIALVRDPTVGLQARLMYERLWIHLALHLHRETAQFAGPHCRAYWNLMTTGQGPLKEMLWLMQGWSWPLEPGPYGGTPIDQLPCSLDLALTEHRLPDVARAWLEHQPQALPCEVRETANAGEGFDLTTYLAPTYALGTASRTYGIGLDDFYVEHHSNYLMLHYARPAERGGWGMMYSRYVVNDQHWGTRAAAHDRSKTANFYDYGNFAGVQSRNKAIALYALQPQAEEVFSLKTVVVFPRVDDLDEIWLDARRIEPNELPVPVEVGSWLIVCDGAVRVGVRMLEPSRLGRDAPLLLERGPDGELWLTAYNYRGAAKRFWDYASLRGAFWRGNLRAGFVVEVANRADHVSSADLLAHLRAAHVADDTDPQHVRTVRFRSGEDDLSLRYDLWHTAPIERRIGGERYDPPALRSPIAAQGSGGRLAVGSAVLETDRQPVWLIAQELDPRARAWIAVSPTDQPTRLRLSTPLGAVTVERIGMARLEWRAPLDGPSVLLVDADAPPVGLEAPAGVVVEYSGVGGRQTT